MLMLLNASVHGRIEHGLKCECKSGLLAEQPHADSINYASPDNPASNVELVRCGDDSILAVEAFLVQIDRGGRPVGDECDTTPTFAAFCEATVHCRFTQTEYRDAVRDVCGADYDRAQATLIYNCLPGTRHIWLVGISFGLVNAVSNLSYTVLPKSCFTFLSCPGDSYMSTLKAWTHLRM